jgi:hypothetical protein
MMRTAVGVSSRRGHISVIHGKKVNCEKDFDADIFTTPCSASAACHVNQSPWGRTLQFVVSIYSL